MGILERCCTNAAAVGVVSEQLKKDKSSLFILPPDIWRIELIIALKESLRVLEWSVGFFT